MRLPQMTTRRWMVAVAVVAVAISAELMRRRSAAYRAKANLYASHEAVARDWSEAADRNAANPNMAIAPRAAARYRRHADYWRALTTKYERAARQPWLPVAPDPPGPPN